MRSMRGGRWSRSCPHAARIVDGGRPGKARVDQNGLMAYPRWLAKINKRLFNPREVRKGKRPILIHTGRVSRTTYYTPMDAHPTKDGFVLVVRYGPRSDWVRNALSEGSARLWMAGEEHSLINPRLVGEPEALEAVPDGYDPGSDFHKADDFLLMDRAG